MEPDLELGYHFFTDNWYNSFPLTKQCPYEEPTSQVPWDQTESTCL